MKFTRFLLLVLIIGFSGLVGAGNVGDVTASSQNNTITSSSEPNTTLIVNPFSINVFEIPEKYKKEMGDYRNHYKRLSGFEFSGLHWDNFVKVYANNDKSVYRKNYFEFIRFINYDEDDDDDDDEIGINILYQEYPVGAVVIKENYSSVNGRPNKAMSLTIMKKMKQGFDTKNGDWLYIQTSTNGKIILEGDHNNKTVAAACSNCHLNIKERDYIFSTFFVAN